MVSSVEQSWDSNKSGSHRTVLRAVVGVLELAQGGTHACRGGGFACKCMRLASRNRSQTRERGESNREKGGEGRERARERETQKKGGGTGDDKDAPVVNPERDADGLVSGRYPRSGVLCRHSPADGAARIRVVARLWKFHCGRARGASPPSEFWYGPTRTTNGRK